MDKYRVAVETNTIDEFFEKYKEFIYIEERPLTEAEFDQIMKNPSVESLVLSTRASASDFYISTIESYGNYTMDTVNGVYKDIAYILVDIAIGTQFPIIGIATSLIGAIYSNDVRYYSDTLEVTEVDTMLTNKSVKGPDGKTYCFADEFREANTIEITQWINGTPDKEDDPLGVVRKRYHSIFNNESAMIQEALNAYNSHVYPNIPRYLYSSTGAVDWRKDLSNQY